MGALEIIFSILILFQPMYSFLGILLVMSMTTNFSDNRKELSENPDCDDRSPATWSNTLPQSCGTGGISNEKITVWIVWQVPVR